jgi:short-subunit dehydrogenase
VVLAARREERLDEVADACSDVGGESIVRVTDVAGEGEVQALVRETVDRLGRVDVMVNNAGIGSYGAVHEVDEEEMRRIFEVNYFAAWQGCKAVAPVMIEQGSGHVFNVSSVIGRRGTPMHGAYCASKFALVGLTESMRVEMMDHGVLVTAVLPGLTRTEFFQHSGGGSRQRSSFVKLRTMMSPHEVAERIATTVGRRVPELRFTPGGRFLAMVAPVSPRLADRMMKIYHDDLRKGD